MPGPLDALKPQALSIAKSIGSLVASQATMQSPEGFMVSMIAQLAFLRSYEESLLGALAQAGRDPGGQVFADEVMRVAGEVAADLTKQLRTTAEKVR